MWGHLSAAATAAALADVRDRRGRLCDRADRVRRLTGRARAMHARGRCHLALHWPPFCDHLTTRRPGRGQALRCTQTVVNDEPLGP